MTPRFRHVPGVENRAADSISRNNLPLFFHLLPQALPSPCRVPDDLVSHLIRDRPWTSEDWKTWLGTLLTTRWLHPPDECMPVVRNAT